MDMKAKSAQLWDALRKSETTGAFTIFPNATGEIEQALTEAHDAGLAEEQAWGKNYRDNIVRLERERSALTAELAAAQEELESIQPDTDEHRTIADSIAGHRKWASATEKCERMCLEKAEKAEAEVIRQRGVNAALVIEKQKREAAEKERDRFQNQLGEKFPTSFGKLDWACGHTGPAACLQCFEGKCASADTLARELAAKNERLEYLEGQDRSLLEQHQASMITLGDSDLLAVGGRLLDRAEKAEAKLAEKEAELELAEEHIGWLPESTYQAQGAELEGVKEQNAVLTAEAGRLREALGIVSSSADDCMLSHGEYLCCIREAGLVRIAEEALSPEPEKPAPDVATIGPDGGGQEREAALGGGEGR